MLRDLIRLRLSKDQTKRLASGKAIRLTRDQLSDGGDIPVVLEVKTIRRILSAINRGWGIQLKLNDEELQANMELESKTGGIIFGSILGGLMGGGVVGDVVSGGARLAKQGVVGSAKMMLRPRQSLADAVIQHQGERMIGALVPRLPQGFLPVKQGRKTRGEGLFPPGVRG